MKRKLVRKLAVAAIVSLIVLVPLLAETESGPALKPTFGFADADFYWAQFKGGVEGFELVPGVSSAALLYLGAGYYSDSYYRDAAGARLVDPSLAFTGASFNEWGSETRLGLDLGLVPKSQGEGNLLTLQLYLRDVWKTNVGAPAAYTSTALDGAGYLENSLLARLDYAGVELDIDTRTREGLNAEASVEWAPSFLLNNLIGKAHWWRLNSRIAGFLPIVKTSAFGLYVGDRLVLDAVGGPSLPSHIQRQIGGFKAGKAMGGAVRGIDSYRYDGNVKIVNNFDVRATLPAIFGKGLVPELFVFTDQGFVDNRDYFATPGQLLLTAGGGLVLDFLAGSSPLELGYYVTYNLTERAWSFFNFIILGYQF
jgi:hypothetical protein